MSSSSPASQFGPNEWLVEEMYDQFLADPSSVDAAWHDFFSDFTPTQTPRTKPDAARETSQPDRPTEPEQPVQANGQVRPAPAKAPARPVPGRPASAKPRPAAAKPTAAPVAAKEETGPEEAKQLRGAAAAIAKNMDASLTVPTATSVRAVPAKLMADNRIVINNHLARTRGGKISFTHLIGYAMVRALHDFPNMNRHYSVSGGKPFAITPEHVNLGLAIDMKGKDGNRSLVVASIKNTENMTSLQPWPASQAPV